jgi:triosephosphate isomerase (TIM)
VLSNWKMYTTVREAVALFREIQSGLEDRARHGNALPIPIVCPPFVSLVPIHELLDERLVRLGAQNCHWESEGPYTGEIAAPMLSGIAQYVLIGHSERRAAGETDDEISRKVAAAARAGLTPILFVGEDEPGDRAAEQVEQRLRRGLEGLDLELHQPLLVYEPTWAIGADRPADPAHVAEMVARLKGRLRELGSGSPEVIYGGTVSDDNVERFASIEPLDGVGATRAGLDPRRFLGIVDRVAAARGPS